MSETMVAIIIALITALGSVIAALINKLARKGVDYLDEKTKILDETHELQKKEAIKQKIVDVVTLCARSTMQTYVEELKVKNKDGKLTPEEAQEAFKRTYEQALAILKQEGIEAAKEVLSVIIEAIVGSLKFEKKTLAARV